MRNIITIIVLLALCVGSHTAHAQRKTSKGKAQAAQKAPELTPEEIAAKQLEEARQRHIDELLLSTRRVTFIDSLVAPKDNFLPRLGLTDDAGRFTDPQLLFSAGNDQYITGRAAFVNGLASAVYFSVADSTGHVRLHAAHRNADHWATPQPLRGLEDQDYQDYPFMLSDGTTLYYAAQSDDGIGGLDLYVTRYSSSSRQFVRPENLGFPFNSTANDYLLAIDEACGVGVLVTDRQQPDDKVCIYWFIAEDNYPTINFDPDDEEALDEVRRLAAIESIVASQSDKSRVVDARQRWQAALSNQQAASSAAQHKRFVINDATVYTSLADFHSEEARQQAALWDTQTRQLAELRAALDDLRLSEAARSEADSRRMGDGDRLTGRRDVTRSQKQEQQIRNLEVQVAELERAVKQSAKAFRRLEINAKESK